MFPTVLCEENKTNERQCQCTQESLVTWWGAMLPLQRSSVITLTRKRGTKYHNHTVASFHWWYKMSQACEKDCYYAANLLQVDIIWQWITVR